MDVWHWWVIAALVLFLIEIFTSGFAVLCLSIGALFGAVAAAFGWDVKTQLLCFAIGSLIGFLAVRPLLLKYFFKKRSEVLTNAEALVGKKARVCEAITEIDGGRVAVDGDNWKAVSEDGSPIAAGEWVTITKVESIILTVKKI